MFNNFATMLNNLDNIAQENLEEPKISATSLRQQKKAAAEESNNSASIVRSGSSSSVGATFAHTFGGGSSNNSEASFVVVEENDNHSDVTVSPKSTLSNSSSTEYVTTSSVDKHQLQHNDSSRFPTGSTTTSTSEKDTRQLIISKNKEIEKLNRECLELETQNEGLKHEVREAWEAYKSAQEKAALREADYQEDMSQLERAKSSDREGMAAHVKTMEKELQTRRNECSALRTEHERVMHILHTLQEESKDWLAKKEDLETSLEIAQANNNQSLQGLREELRNKDAYIERVQSEHSNVMRRAHERHDALEQANSDLTSSLMAKEREVTRLVAQQNALQGSQGGRESAVMAEVSKIRMQLEQVSGSLLEEQQQHQATLKRLRAAEQEADINRTAWEEEKQNFLSRISDIASEQHVLVDTTSGAEAGSGQGQERHTPCQDKEVARLDEQVRTLGQQLLRKQETLEEYLSERAALKVRLQDAQRRCQKYEEQVARLLEAQDPYDYEANIGTDVAGGGSGGLRKRGLGSSNSGGGGSGNRAVRASQDLQKLGVHASPGVSKAVDMIDTWTLITGRHLKAYPLLRLTFVLYLLLIHLWAFCLLAYHAHSLDLDNENANEMTSNKLIRNIST